MKLRSMKPRDKFLLGSFPQAKFGVPFAKSRTIKRCLIGPPRSWALRFILPMAAWWVWVSLQWSELIFGIIALSLAKIQSLSLQLCRVEFPKIQSRQKFACRLSVSTLLKILHDAWTVPRVYYYAVGKASTLEVDV